MTARPTIRAPRLCRLGVLLLPLTVVGAGETDRNALAAEPAVAFERGPDGMRITIGGKPFARYDEGTGDITRPYFDAIHAPGGTRVTRNNPPVEGKDSTDHVTFHPGLWMAFGDLNGADSWRNKDRIRHAGFVEAPRGGPGRGTFAVRNRHEKAGAAIAEEVCRVTILVRPEGVLMLWDSEFRPEWGELAFGDQEEMGLGVRLATPLAVVKGGRIDDSEGRVNEAQVWGKQADWCRYGGERAGVLLMPHPGNFRRSWFHARDYGLLVANPFGRNAFTRGEKSRVVVKPEETLRLRFGVLVFSDPLDPNAAFRDYVRLAGEPEGK